MSVDGSYGYSQAVTLTFGGTPPDSGLALSPGSGIPSYEAALQVTTSVSTTPGWYTLVVTGTGGTTHTRLATVTLAVDAVAPMGTLTLISPTQGITNVARRPLFAWTPVTDARVYRLQVAGENTFAAPLVDAVLEGTSYRPGDDLPKNESFYWRVVAENGCGTIGSPVHVFTTVNPVAVFYDLMESGGGAWSAETASGTGWTLTDRLYHSSDHAWYKASDDRVSEAWLVLGPAIAVEEGSKLSFWHWHYTESAGADAYDGGVLEISADGDWQDLGDQIVQNGYNCTVKIGQGNPLESRPAWGGNSDGWVRVEVDLSSFAGSAVRIRFGWGGDVDDRNPPYGGWFWYVDDVQISVLYPPFRHKSYLPLASRNG